jgi:hypothetical protein
VDSVRSLMEVADWLSAVDTIALADCLYAGCPDAARLDSLQGVPAALDTLRADLQGALHAALEGAAEFKGMDEVTLSCCRELEVCVRSAACMHV